MNRYRYLGFAFASADLLFEVEPGSGSIAFAVGATGGLAAGSEGDLVGRSWRDLIAPSDQTMVECMFAGLEAGRCGPVPITLSPLVGSSKRFGSLSMCRLTPESNISCAANLNATHPVTEDVDLDADGYVDRVAFEQVAKTLVTAAATVGQELDVALIEIPGLADTLADAGPRKASAILQRFSGALRAEAYAGGPAARLADDRFAVVRPKGREPERIHHRLTSAMAAGGMAMDIAPKILPIEPGVGALDRSLRALRYAIDNFAAEGASSLTGASLNEAFNRSVQRTLAEAGEFGEAIKSRRFNLVFQPIVSLTTGELGHYETLVRFHEDTSPYKLIRMAEDLDLILELDLAIAEQALGRLKADKTQKLKLAVNVSGRSIMDPWFVSELRRLAEPVADAGKRLAVEITESVEIENLSIANRHIQQLRGDGHTVCLDDFGAGAASYAYLQKLHVDVIKIDGRYVKELTEENRDSALVRHLVGLCRELEVETIAEMITNEAVEKAARAAGVDYGQGYFYGEPVATTSYQPRPKPINGRRKGLLEQWG